ncbi:MAG: PorT family protein [Bacteroidetes bacterium]|nr:PorT family protein [Bacteroidota bacterium]
MKNVLRILPLIFVLAHSITMAQKGKELIIGAGGALTNVWIMNQNFYGEPEVEYAPKIGYAASFNLGYNIDGHAAIMTEVQYSLQGQKYSDKQNIDGVKYEVDRNISLAYLNFPLFFKYAFGEENTRFRFMIGPQLGILLDATQDYLRDGKKLGTEATDLDGNGFITDATDIKDRFEKYDYGLAFDVGADFHLSKQWFLSAGFRGNYGFTDINAEPYRIKDIDNEYSPSHNAWGGIYININYKVDVEGYNQRSF